jgi:phosphatidylserine decarboxylase
MSADQPSASAPRAAMPIHSVQPGGGAILRLELAWGRLRRALIRRYQPDYVQRMLALRQGECPDCPHDILDSRDLKFCRNVCGFWFRPEDDAFLWRNRLGLARIGLAEIVVFSVLLGILSLVVLALADHNPWFALLYVPIVLIWSEIFYFFRDPERAIPAAADALVSPADGTITDVGEVAEPDFPDGRAFRIGIFLSIFNVHVNRAPRAGTVMQLRYYPGGFLDARHPQAGSTNEQLWIDLQDTATGRPIRVKQIAGKIARRIVCWLKQGEEVKAGVRIGMIKFGSRTEVYLPLEVPVEALVKVGDKVKGGSTILLRLK